MKMTIGFQKHAARYMSNLTAKCILVGGIPKPQTRMKSGLFWSGY